MTFLVSAKKFSNDTEKNVFGGARCEEIMLRLAVLRVLGEKQEGSGS